jgi:predicted dehydrogenase
MSRAQGEYDVIINETTHGKLSERTLSPGGSIAFFSGSADGPEFIEAKQWLDAILYDREPLVKPEQAFTVTKILDNIYKSAESGAEIKF